jgi:hypothetical protein
MRFVFRGGQLFTLFLRGVLEPNHVENLVMTVQVTKI